MSSTAVLRHGHGHDGEAETSTVALAGNPNAGKTALFNALTGVRQKTGNWPGVTVERKVGRYNFDGTWFSLVDLPGTYSLDATSPDQLIARDAILSGDIDVVVNVLDASNLERHLNLALQLIEMRVPTVIALNMVDVAERQGITIDVDALSSVFGCEVVRVVGTTGQGVHELEAAVARAAAAGAPPRLVLTDPTPSGAGQRPGSEGQHPGDERKRPEGGGVEDDDVQRAGVRFALARAIAAEVAVRPNTTVGTVSDRVDRLLLHRIWAVPIFLGVMYLMFMFTINIGGAFVDLFDGVAGAIFVDGGRAVLDALGAPEWLVVLLADGVGGGVQVVATFVPIIGALYLFLSVLEDSGYLARAAFVMDRTLRRIGLPGKAFVPMIVGFGCNVPAVMATRTLDTERERKLTILMNPFMSCGARLPVYALFAAAFFPSSGQNLVFLLYLIGIAVAVGTGLVMRHSLLGGTSEGFLMEVPAYHRPTLRNALLHTWDRLRVFVRGAGAVIVAMVAVLAVVNSVGTDGSFGNEGSENSVLSAAGRTITPVFAPMGLKDDNWPATVGIFTGVLAKEAVVGTLDSLYGTLAAEEDGAEGDEPFEFWNSIGDALATVPGNLADAVGAVTDPLGIGASDVESLATATTQHDVDTGVYGAMQSRYDGRAGAFAYLLFVLLYFPCVATIGAIVREAGRRWALFVAAWTTGIAYVVATAFYQAATLPDHPGASIAWLVTLGVAVVVAFVLLRRWGNRRPAPAAVPVQVRPRRADAPAQD
jgi:ferrous iron transport protein B